MNTATVETAIEEIKEQGYCRVPQVFGPDDVRKALNLAKTWMLKSEEDLSDNVPFLNRNQPMVYNLQNKDYYFLEMLFMPAVLQKILMHFLNDIWYKQIPQDQPNYILRSYLGRSSNAALPLHIDSFVPYESPYPFAMQASIILEDQNEVNGCTVIVPGSHKTGEYATPQALDDALPIHSNAGDLVVWDSRLWHGTTANHSEGTRWALIATFVRWWIKQGFDMTQSVPQHIYEKLTDNQKSIIGFCSIPYQDERSGIDMKQGYESLKTNVAYYQR